MANWGSRAKEGGGVYSLEELQLQRLSSGCALAATFSTASLPAWPAPDGVWTPPAAPQLLVSSGRVLAPIQTYPFEIINKILFILTFY